MTLLHTLFFCSLIGKVLMPYARDVTPPRNSIVTELRGERNVEFMCTVIQDLFGPDYLVITEWKIKDYNGSTNYEEISTMLGSTIVTISGGFRNILTIHQFNEDLHGATIACTYDIFFIFSEHPLAVYQIPPLQSYHFNFMVGSSSFVLNMEGNSRTANPYPRSYIWKLNGNAAINGSGKFFSYPYIIIDTIEVTDHGYYTLTAINYFLDVPSLILGNITGSLTLYVFRKSIFKVKATSQ